MARMPPHLCQPDKQKELPEQSSHHLFPDQLVALAIHGLDAGATVGEPAQFVADAGEMHVDTAVESCQWSSERLLRQVALAHWPACLAGEDFEQVVLGTGQVDRGAGPFDTALVGAQAKGTEE